MHWLLYVPGEASQSDLLPGVGLSHLAEGACTTIVKRGPDGGIGTLVGWVETEPKVFRPDQQTWLPAVEYGHLPESRYWVGLWRDRPPTPRECERPHPVRGRAIRFGDGQDWTVPKAVEVPYTMVATSAGWGFAPLRRYTSWLVTVDLWRRRCDEAQEGDSYDFGEIADFVLESLSINYRLTREVVTALEMFRSGQHECLLSAALAVVALAREAA